MTELMNYGYLEMDQTWVSSELKISPTKVPENYSRIRDVKIRFGSTWHLAFLDRAQGISGAGRHCCCKKWRALLGPQNFCGCGFSLAKINNSWPSPAE